MLNKPQSQMDAITPNAAKPKRRTQAERTALSDQRIFDAAISLISKQGAHRTTLKEIGELAGYSRGLATYRFGSKDSLFRALIAHFNQVWVRELTEFVGDKRGSAAFLGALDAVEDFLITQPDYMRGMYILWYESIGCETDVRQRLASMHGAYRRDAQHWIEQGIADGDITTSMPARDLAAQFVSFILGTIYQWLVSPQAINLRSTFAAYRNLLEAALVRR
jgi:AcrR family transcriptional regulator